MVEQVSQRTFRKRQVLLPGISFCIVMMVMMMTMMVMMMIIIFLLLLSLLLLLLTIFPENFSQEGSASLQNQHIHRDDYYHVPHNQVSRSIIIAIRDARSALPRPQGKWLPWTAPAPKNFQDIPAPSHPKNAPSLTVTLPRPEDFTTSPATPQNFFPLPRPALHRPEAKKAAPCIPG